jgi:hypothetical protein
LSAIPVFSLDVSSFRVMVFSSLVEMHEWQISGAATTAEFGDFLATSSQTLSTLLSATTQNSKSFTTTSTNATNATIMNNGSTVCMLQIIQPEQS